MKAKVYVTLKPGVLDPQGKAIHGSLALMGYANLADVRQGKYFELEIDAEDAAMRTNVERIAGEVLANPVIEDYRVEFER